MRAKLAESYGWSFAEIDDMSLEQIGSAWRGGKKPEGLKTTSLEQAIEWANDMKKNWRKYYGV